MATLMEILANKDVGDDQTITLGGVEFKVKDLRDFTAAAERDRQAAQSRMTQAEQAQRQADELAQQAANLLAQLQAQPPVKTGDSTVPADWTTDPLFQPLVPVLKPALERVTSFDKAVESLQKMINQVQGIYALRELERQWSSYQPQLKGKNVTFEQAVQQVIQRKDVDRWGVPTFDKLVAELTAPDREAAIRAEERAAAEKEWKAKVDAATKAATMPKPGAAFRPPVKAGKPPIAKIEELTAEAIAGDEDIAKLVAGVQ